MSIKNMITIISLSVSGSTAWAESITDNLGRANTAQAENTVHVGGTGWVQDGDGAAAGTSALNHTAECDNFSLKVVPQQDGNRALYRSGYSSPASDFIPEVPNLNPTRSDPGYNTPAGRNWIRREFKRQWGGRFDPEVYLPFFHPTINAPLMDGVLLEVPKILTDSSPLAQWGFVDVTAPPFGADPTGEKDSTRVLQAAINFACAHQMVAYFPPGVYRLSDTLHANQGLYLQQAGTFGVDNFVFPNVLVGSTRDPAKRARLVLQSSSPGFGDAEKPKPIVRFFSPEFYPTRWPQRPSLDVALARHMPSGCYNHLFASIDIEIEQGNPGAAGINMRAAEGSSIQDVTIYAGDGHSGLLELPGSGGSCIGITVIGGRYGIDAILEDRQLPYGVQPVPTITHLTLRGQKEAPIRAYTFRGGLVLVGARIESDAQGPLIQMLNPNHLDIHTRESRANAGQLVMVDSRLERTSGVKDYPLISSARSVVLHNVYTKGAFRVVNEHGSEKKSDEGWTRYDYLAVSLPPLPQLSEDLTQTHILREEPILVNGKDMGALMSESAAETPPADLCSQHLWDTGLTHWDSPGVVNVKEAPYFAKGDGLTDDTEALQRAINENEALFFPKGLYNISRTLKLKPDTKMLGAAMHLSLIYSRNPEGYFYSDQEARPLVETADDPEATTLIAFIGFRINCERPQLTDPAETKHYAVKWQSGSKSIWRFNYVNPQTIIEYDPTQAGKYSFEARESRPVVATPSHPAVLITGNGGGRWYNFFYENYWPGHPIRSQCLYELYRTVPFIKIENTPTETRFYHFLLQHMKGAQRYHCEIDKASSVKIYGIKAEPYANFLRASDSGSIEIVGYGGSGGPLSDVSMFVFEECESILFAGYAQEDMGRDRGPYSIPSRKYYTLLDRKNDKETKLDWFIRPLLYKRSQ